MEPWQAFERWTTAGEASMVEPTVADLVAWYGGTRRTAERVGVSQRAIQRYVTQARERRAPGGRGARPEVAARIRAALDDLRDRLVFERRIELRDALAERVKAHGVYIDRANFPGLWFNPDPRGPGGGKHYSRGGYDIVNLPLPPSEDMDAFAAAIADGDWFDASQAFERAFGYEYGGHDWRITDIAVLDMGVQA